MIRSVHACLIGVFLAAAFAGFSSAAEPAQAARKADLAASALSHAQSSGAAAQAGELPQAPEPGKQAMPENPGDKVAIMGEMVPIIVSLGFFAAVVIIIAIPLVMRTRRDRMLHQTIRAMVEKGVAIPPELIITPKRKGSDVHRGIVLIAAGAGIVSFFMLFADAANKPGLWSIGLIPLFIGIGYLVAARLEGNKSNGKDAA